MTRRNRPLYDPRRADDSAISQAAQKLSGLFTPTLYTALTKGTKRPQLWSRLPPLVIDQARELAYELGHDPTYWLVRVLDVLCGMHHPLSRPDVPYDLEPYIHTLMVGEYSVVCRSHRGRRPAGRLFVVTNITGELYRKDKKAFEEARRSDFQQARTRYPLWEALNLAYDLHRAQEEQMYQQIKPLQLLVNDNP